MQCWWWMVEECMVENRCHSTIKNRILKLKNFYSPDKPYLELTDKQSQLITNFNYKVKNGEIKLEQIPCLCGNTIFDLIAGVDRYGMRQDTVLCTKCGLILSNPRMTDEEYSAFYSSDLYRTCYEGENYIEIYKRDKYKIETGQHIFGEVNKIKQIGSDAAILEFGAGGGWNLLPFIKAGANVVGMDYSPSLVDLGKEYGINMIRGGLTDIKGSFDVIILNHVLEHFLDPVVSLKMVANHLNKDGIIYIAVPDIMNFGIGQLQNVHVWYFTLKTFEYYCSMAGLKVLKSGHAEDIHIFGIFKTAVSNEKNNNFLTNNYSEMRAHVRKAKWKEYIKAILTEMHVDKIVRAIYLNIKSYNKN